MIPRDPGAKSAFNVTHASEHQATRERERSRCLINILLRLFRDVDNLRWLNHRVIPCVSIFRGIAVKMSAVKVLMGFSIAFASALAVCQAYDWSLQTGVQYVAQCEIEHMLV